MCSSNEPEPEDRYFKDSTELEEFRKSVVSVMPSISETTRFVVSIIYNEVQKSNKNVDALKKELNDYNIAYNLMLFKQRAKGSEKKDETDEQKAEKQKYAAALSNIMKVKTF